MGVLTDTLANDLRARFRSIDLPQRQDVHLRPFRPSDEDALVKHMNDPSVYEYLIGPPRPYSQKDATWWIEYCTVSPGHMPLQYAIASKRDEELIGAMGLSTLAAPYTSLGLRDSHASSHVQQAISNGTVRIWHHANDADDAVQDGEGEGEWPAYVLGYWLSPAYRGQGLMQTSISAFLQALLPVLLSRSRPAPGATSSSCPCSPAKIEKLAIYATTMRSNLASALTLERATIPLWDRDREPGRTSNAGGVGTDTRSRGNAQTATTHEHIGTVLDSKPCETACRTSESSTFAFLGTVPNCLAVPSVGSEARTQTEWTVTQKEREREDVYVFGAKWIVEASANANVDEQR